MARSRRYSPKPPATSPASHTTAASDDCGPVSGRKSPNAGRGGSILDRFRWAERHDGLITNDAARAAGRTRRQLERDRAVGRLRKVRRGVSVVNGAPPTWRQAVRAVLLSNEGRVAASHWTAVTLLGGRMHTEIEQIHVITDLDHQVVLAGVVCHRSGLLEEGDLVRRDGMLCTSPLVGRNAAQDARAATAWLRPW